MESFGLIQDNLLSPIVLAFFFGIIAKLIHSDLKIPEVVHTGMAIYFLFGVGLRGGVELSANRFAIAIGPVLGAIVLGALIPLGCLLTLTRQGKFSATYAAVIASHYGFVSTVCVFAAMNWLNTERLKIPFPSDAEVWVPLLEFSSLAATLVLAYYRAGMGMFFREIAREILAGKSILLMLGGAVIGLAAGRESYQGVVPFFEEPFKGIITLLMIELGMIAADRFKDLRQYSILMLLGLGILAPTISGVVGVIVGHLVGLDLGGRMILGVLAASSSYISAAVAVRVSFPDLNPDNFFAASLSILLPFILTVGFPLFLALARYL